MNRVLDSWFKMEDEYVHRERVEEFDTWQEANSFIPGLPIKAFYDPYEFAWARALRDNAKTIQDEFQRVAILGADDLQRRGNNIWIGAANATSAAAYGGDWKTLALMDRCNWDDVNTACFPETTRLLRELGVPCLEAFFARMTPRSRVGSHSDYCNFALTAHLGLDIPEGQCWIQVGDQRRGWRNGEVLLFDTSLLHQAANDADRTRYILMLRVFHHALAPHEIGAIRAIFSYLDDPALLERDLLAHAPDLVRQHHQQQQQQQQQHHQHQQQQQQQQQRPPAPAPPPAPALKFGDAGAKNHAGRRAARRGGAAAPAPAAGGFAPPPRSR
jgi:hypothetical protein